MKYAVNYNKNFKYNKEIDEFIIFFKPTDKSLFNFIKNNQEKRIIIHIDDNVVAGTQWLKIIEGLKDEHPELKNWVLRFKNELSEAYLSLPADIPFFFSSFIKDWYTLHGYMSLKVTDIYIVESLGFEIKTIAKILHDNEIKVRAFPNVAQSSWNNTPGLRKFFIRPEDMKFYEDYIDICEFMGRDNQISTYYSIYAIDKKWNGPLNEIIISLNSEIDNQYILPSFGTRRLECGLRCMKDRPCNVCMVMDSLASTLKEKGLKLKTLTPKKKTPPPAL